MNSIERIARLQLDRVQTLVFAGGGNRCWWQGGVLAHWLEQDWPLPRHFVGTSAGAGVAASCLAAGPVAALEACVDLFAGQTSLFARREPGRLLRRFAHTQLYPAWIAAFINAGQFERLRASSTRLQVAITRPARWLGLAGSVAAGTFAYLIEKQLRQSIHPRLPKLLGLRQDFVDLRACSTVEDAQALLHAAAAAPPFLPARRIGGKAAIDGGYTDNAPIPAQTAVERAGTLVLLTRHYPRLPLLFRSQGRHYWQPSLRVPVSTWDCTLKATVREAFELGRRDAAAGLQRGELRSP